MAKSNPINKDQANAPCRMCEVLGAKVVAKVRIIMTAYNANLDEIDEEQHWLCTHHYSMFKEAMKKALI